MRVDDVRVTMKVHERSATFLYISLALQIDQEQVV